MFYSLTGKLIYMESGMIAVECGGVAFKCLTSMTTQKDMPAIGANVTVFTHMNVREDALDLFGFSTKAEMECFKMLTSVSGVGPKVGLAILSEMNAERVALCVAGGDSKSFTRANGVGPKLAQRIVLELRDKVKALTVPGTKASSEGLAAGVISASRNAAEAVTALSVLGYNPSEAAEVVAKFDSTLPVEELIRLSLRAMASKF
ncbi:MAG: Holliday junction branch migration protein RuvA [Clostridia bacterium]|nr:Holliday junction branch migration protein RuvA [Clostridia bacterium]